MALSHPRSKIVCSRLSQREVNLLAVGAVVSADCRAGESEYRGQASHQEQADQHSSLSSNLCTQQRVQSGLVETDHHLTVNHRHRSGEHAQLLQFGERRRVFGHVALNELDTSP